MKIIYLHQYFNTPDMSGGTRSYEMARRMVSAGHEVDMITTRIDGALEGKEWVVEEISGMRVHWLPVEYNNKMGITRRLMAFTEFARRASIYAASLRGDVVFATSTPLTIAIPGVRASRKLKAPMVFEVRDLWPEIPIAMGALKLPGSAFLARRLEAWAYLNSQKIVALSPGMRDGIIGAGVAEDKVACIPNSADLELFQGSEQAGLRFRSDRSWLGNRPLVLYAGTFGRVNGVEYMARLAAEMLVLDPDIRFLAVGAGAEREDVAVLAQSLGVLDVNFFIEDALPKKQMAAPFAAATVCCSWVIDLKPLWNNSANKVFDAMAAGKPVVINHGGWQKELVEQQGIGLALPINDANLAASTLREFLMSESRVERAGAAALELAKSRFSRDILANDLIRTLEHAVEEC